MPQIEAWIPQASPGATAGERPQTQDITKWLLVVCFGIDALMWFCDWTDYSLPGPWWDLALPVAGTIAGASALRLSQRIVNRALRRLTKLVALAMLVEGAASIIVATLFCIIAPLGVMFILGDMGTDAQTATVPSPNRFILAEEYYTDGSAISDGVESVELKYPLFPFVERDIYSGPGRTSGDVSWLDNDTLYLPGSSEPTHIGLVQWEWAPPVKLGVMTWSLIGALSAFSAEEEQRQQHDEQMAIPLKDIPIYPGGATSDYSGADMLSNGGYRAFDIKSPNSDDAATWYKDALSRSPWSVISTRRREKYDTTVTSVGIERLVYNCIDSLRTQPDGTSAHYYWEFIWGEQSTSVRVIVNTPDKPAWSDCDDSPPGE